MHAQDVELGLVEHVGRRLGDPECLAPVQLEVDHQPQVRRGRRATRTDEALDLEIDRLVVGGQGRGRLVEARHGADPRGQLRASSVVPAIACATRSWTIGGGWRMAPGSMSPSSAHIQDGS